MTFKFIKELYQKLRTSGDTSPKGHTVEAEILPGQEDDREVADNLRDFWKHLGTED